MMTPEDALQTLDDAWGLLAEYAPDRDVYVRIGFMRDELWRELVNHDPRINDALWAWLQETSYAYIPPFGARTVIYSSGTVATCPYGHQWIRTRQYRWCPVCNPPGHTN